MGPHDRLSAVFIGEGTLLIQCADLFLKAGHRIVGLVSAEPMIGRWAAERSLRHVHPSQDVVASLQSAPFDVLFSIVNLAILPPALLALPKMLAINFHDGPLPKYAGLHATSWALLNREAAHGVTWHEMKEAVDTGRILKQRRFDISPGETAFSLNTKCYEAGISSFGDLVHDLSTGALTFSDPQLHARSYVGKYARPAAACTISWAQSAEEIAALVRALDFGRYRNPLGLPKLHLGHTAVLVREIEVLDDATAAPPGTVLVVGEGQLRVSTCTQDIVLRSLQTVSGQPLASADSLLRLGVRLGDRLPDMSPEAAARLTAITDRVVRAEEQWARRLASLESVELPYATRSDALHGPAEHARATMSIGADLLPDVDQAAAGASRADRVAAALAVYLARLGEKQVFDVGFSDATTWRELSGQNSEFAHLFAARAPLHVAVDGAGAVNDALLTVTAEIARVRRHGTYTHDVVVRVPELRSLLAQGGRPVFPISIEIVDDLEAHRPCPQSELTLLVAADGSAVAWVYDPRVFSADNVALMQGQFREFLGRAARGATPLATLSLLSDEQRTRLLVEWNATGVAYQDAACIHHLFEAQVDRTPDAVAVRFEHEQLTYRQLDSRANQLARHLQTLGVGPESLVGICLERSLDLMVALYAVHKAGGAYVPLDPAYPVDRLRFMVEDAGLSVLLTQEHLADHLGDYHAQTVRLDTDHALIARQDTSRPASAVTSEDLAYVIYTSGSTGRPKGVMVSHRNAVNFFAGMDERLDTDPAGVWLAVTSLSFDISVLELFWTLTRGFTVVLYADQKETGRHASARPASPTSRKPLDFSLFYFASDEGEGVADKYRLLLEGAKFADRHGFSAVWTPERHFHAFGGLYPNPSVASAAIATITERVQIRAGSVVLPLHSPIRVAEEWSFVDNLSKGRVGISFAAGWQPQDFAIAPARFADRKQSMVREIDTVRALWRGETVRFPGPNGEDVEVRTLPRPVQSELPVWVTAAGSPDTFRIAGELGAGLLTHLLGQNLDELAAKLAIYRQAWRDGGHPGNGHVTLMLHTFVGDDEDAVRETVREPMKAYLRSSVDLIRKAAWSFPAFAHSLQGDGQNPSEIFDSGTLSDEEMEALLDHAFERYFRTSGLFGTPESCLDMVDKLKAIDVDEVACLIDFGIPSTMALDHLTQLAQLKHLSERATEAPDFSIPALIERHGVTHLQCTPSMAGMLLMDDETSNALRPLKNVMIGGEAFPIGLAKQLTALVQGRVINMYGPTETTIWSSTYTLDDVGTTVSIGRPIANTQLYILDRQLEPAPVGVAGELFIGGDGVVRGYLNRPELTAERFIRDPFSDRPGARLYRTGDLARYRADGNIEFLGRIDHQVKVRGYRIELGEIEALLLEQPSVKEAVVIAREDVPGDIRLVGYVVPQQAGYTQQASSIDTAELRAVLEERLPSFMVPAHLVVLDALPLTPNAKIDRKALPAPDRVEVKSAVAFIPPASDLETTILDVWRASLNVAQVSVNDNFFDLGGHSLLMVQVQHKLRDVLGRSLSITDLFRFPTIRSLAAHLGRDADAPAATQQSVERAETRRDMRELLLRRRQMRPTATR